MAFKNYYFLDKIEGPDNSKFIGDMEKVRPPSCLYLFGDPFPIPLRVYDVNDVAVIHKRNSRDHNIGNITMVGELEKIIKTKSEIEEKTGIKLEEEKSKILV